MTTRIYKDLEQGSQEWLEARRGVLTASTIGQLVTPKTIKPASNDTSRALIASLAAERITGRVETVYPSRDMQRGTFEEPRAREWYAEFAGVDVEQVGFIVRDEDEWSLGYSPDGLVGDAGLIEIKAPRAKKHVAWVLGDQMPLEHMAQVQAGLLVTGREWCDFVSFVGGLAPWVVRVEKDDRWQDALTDAAIVAREQIAGLVESFALKSQGEPVEFIDWFADEDGVVL